MSILKCFKINCIKLKNSSSVCSLCSFYSCVKYVLQILVSKLQVSSFKFFKVVEKVEFVETTQGQSAALYLDYRLILRTVNKDINKMLYKEHWFIHLYGSDFCWRQTQSRGKWANHWTASLSVCEECPWPRDDILISLKIILGETSLLHIENAKQTRLDMVKQVYSNLSVYNSVIKPL